MHVISCRLLPKLPHESDFCLSAKVPSSSTWFEHPHPACLSDPAPVHESTVHLFSPPCATRITCCRSRSRPRPSALASTGQRCVSRGAAAAAVSRGAAAAARHWCADGGWREANEVGQRIAALRSHRRLWLPVDDLLLGFVTLDCARRLTDGVPALFGPSPNYFGTALDVLFVGYGAVELAKKAGILKDKDFYEELEAARCAPRTRPDRTRWPARCLSTKVLHRASLDPAPNSLTPAPTLALAVTPTPTLTNPDPSRSQHKLSQTLAKAWPGRSPRGGHLRRRLLPGPEPRQTEPNPTPNPNTNPNPNRDLNPSPDHL